MTPEKNVLLELFATYRSEFGYSFIAAVVATARHWQKGDSFREIATNGIIVAAIAFGMNTILGQFGIDEGKWGYLASVFLGYVGHKVFVNSLLDRFTKGGSNGVPTRKQ